MLIVSGYTIKRKDNIFTYYFTYKASNGKQSHMVQPIIKVNTGGRKPHISFWPISKLPAVEAYIFSKALANAAYILSVHTGPKLAKLSMTGSLE